MKKLALLILDGWGIGRTFTENAIYMAKTPFFERMLKEFPSTTLITSGEDVGLPVGQMGNSEVGHLNIGAGRIVYQDLVKINIAIKEHKIDHNSVLLEAISYAKKNDKQIHLMGLLSDGGVHSHIEHLKALCTILEENECSKVFIHAFTDGRDTDPKGGINYLSELMEHVKNYQSSVASVIGRYFAMDRDKRWERVKFAYDALVNAVGNHVSDPRLALLQSYEDGITDEFIKPIIVSDQPGKAIAKIEADDVVLCFNFRTDRAREITEVLTQNDMKEHGMYKLPLRYLTMTNYDDTFKDIEVLFHKDNLNQTLGEVLQNNQRTQLRMAETEKYPHVTFFFSGGREIPFEGESRIVVPSPKVATYDLQPEMSASALCAACVKEIETTKPDFICLNFANTDMVGHTGVFSAVKTAVETVDSCAEKIVETGLKNGYSFIVIADHGNAEFMINADGTPNTAHTTNLVPCIIIDKDYKKLHSGRLADISPTILQLLGINKPEEMTGNSLLLN